MLLVSLKISFVEPSKSRRYANSRARCKLIDWPSNTDASISALTLSVKFKISLLDFATRSSSVPIFLNSTAERMTIDGMRDIMVKVVFDRDATSFITAPNGTPAAFDRLPAIYAICCCASIELPAIVAMFLRNCAVMSSDIPSCALRTAVVFTSSVEIAWALPISLVNATTDPYTSPILTPICMKSIAIFSDIARMSAAASRVKPIALRNSHAALSKLKNSS